MTETIINTTPHAVHDVLSGKTFPPSKDVRIRISDAFGDTGKTIGGVSIFTRTWGEVEGLPPFQDGVYYIVSLVVKQVPSIQDRADLLTPGKLVRGEDGAITGCEGLIF